jgi:hypothetical protein
MSARRLLGVIALVVAGSVGLVGPAVAADPYGPHTGDATVNKTRVIQDHTASVSGDGFCAGTAVAVAVSQGGDTYITRTIQADAAGVASTSVTLSQIGLNHLTLTGCLAAGGTQVLSAEVTVVRHSRQGNVSDDSVRKGDTVSVSAGGFCRKAKVLVRVYDDGDLYQARSFKATKAGRAATSFKLTRAGHTTITLQGCREAGGDQLVTLNVRVRNQHSFRSSPVAAAGDFAASLSPARYGVFGGGLLLVLSGAVQVMFARRHRSS